MTTIDASRPIDDIPTSAEPQEQSAGSSVLTAGVSLLAVLGIFAGGAALIGFAFRAGLAFFTG